MGYNQESNRIKKENNYENNIFNMCEDRILFYLPVIGNFTDGTTYPSEGTGERPAGEAIIGASVVVKGTTNGSITDLDGKFSLSDVPSGAMITVSYIGYISQRRKRPLHRWSLS
ncbi:hypothetical protein KUBF_25170 [Bacteroides finegoldii]|nr:hypothetical protein KUBF_25170 [Bacteroides finegoldii]